MRFKIFKNQKRDRFENTQNIKWPEHVITLNRDSFQGFIERYPLSIVDFWASWCAPCKALSARLRRLAQIYRGEVAFGKIDTQKEQGIAKRYNIMSLPHLIFFSYGKKITSATGLKTVGDIKKIIDATLKKIGEK